MSNNKEIRRFEFRDDKSSKFWEIRIESNRFNVRYGKIGTDGQTQIKEFSDAATAEKQGQKLIAEKLEKGYVEIDINIQIANLTPSLAEMLNDSSSLFDSNLTYAEKLELAENKATATHILEVLAYDDEQGIPGSYNELYALRCAVASNPNSPDNLLVKLAEDGAIEVRIKIARNPSISQELMSKLSEEIELVPAVAQNINCPSQLLEKLSKLKNDEVRSNIASNPNCPVQLLKKWSKFEVGSIRASVAGNQSLSVDILKELASDDDTYVRMMVACNPACPKDLLVGLSEDVDSDVRSSVAESEHCSVEILATLENDPNPDVVTQVASNCHTPLPILERLAFHVEDKVRLAVGQNPASPKELQQIALTIPPCCIPENEFLANVMEPVSELQSLVQKARSDFPNHPFLVHPGINDIDFCAPAWCLKIFDIPTQYADRTRSMLEGPFFTSEKYPWPSGGKTKYASPVVQLDLREITRLKGVDYGDGLLQIFLAEDSSTFVIRVIPRSCVDENKMTPFVQGSEDEFDGFMTMKYWLGSDGFVSQIIGYDEPVLSAHVYVSDGNPEDDDPDVLKEIFERMESLSLNDSGIHMFGTFYPIQYCHSDVGGELLMALDSELCYGWGDSGNAQIFVTRNKDGSTNFSVMWSCY
ncbi:MAG: WGR domain-containing protein [Azonexus sp.]|nr:WGR domain-containing protein [Azonexus sp.]